MNKLLVGIEMSRFFLKRAVNALNQWFRAKRAASGVRFIHRLGVDQTGAVALMFIASAALIFGASLGAIDLIRYTDAKARVQASLDNAALALGQMVVTEGAGDLETAAMSYFGAGFPAGYLGSKVTAENISVAVGGGTLTLTFNGELPLISAGFLKVLALGLNSTSVVQIASISDVEVVFALDKGEHISGPGNSTGREDQGSHDLLDSAASRLAELLMKPDGVVIPGVYVGLVPFSSVVNVGPQNNSSARNWVARWQQETSGTEGRKQYSNQDYTASVWRGCIAEPRPWQSPAVSALTPQAAFQPVFVRVRTELKEKSGGADWKGLVLNGIAAGNDEDIVGTYMPGQLMPLRRNSLVNSRFDRRLWAEFEGYSGGQGWADFSMYGAFEPENCLDGYRTRFLSDNYDGVGGVKSALQEIASEPGFTGPPPARRLRGDTVLPAGLLWSWRMLHPDWRGASGWGTGSVPPVTDSKRRVVVLFAGGQNVVSWDSLAADPSGNPNNMEQWDEGTNNRASFVMDYEVEECSKNGKNCAAPASGSIRQHVQAPYLPVKKKQQADDWQRPASSVAMSDPFSDQIKPDFSGWPSVAGYTVDVCKAMRADNILVYVVDVNGRETPELTGCSSSPTLYGTSEADMVALRNVILQNISGSQRLRLLR